MRITALIDDAGVIERILKHLSVLDPQSEILEKLTEKVSKGERWAIEAVLRYCLPKPKPVDPEEPQEFEQRLAQLERLEKKLAHIAQRISALRQPGFDGLSRRISRILRGSFWPVFAHST